LKEPERNKIATGMIDNEGSLDVTISAQYSGTTQNGCVTFENVPLGTYEVSETLQAVWLENTNLAWEQLKSMVMKRK
jgi:hypothetical protein